MAGHLVVAKRRAVYHYGGMTERVMAGVVTIIRISRFGWTRVMRSFGRCLAI
jgi:hypothetical protein